MFRKYLYYDIVTCVLIKTLASVMNQQNLWAVIFASMILITYNVALGYASHNFRNPEFEKLVIRVLIFMYVFVSGFHEVLNLLIFYSEAAEGDPGDVAN